MEQSQDPSSSSTAVASASGSASSSASGSSPYDHQVKVTVKSVGTPLSTASSLDITLQSTDSVMKLKAEIHAQHAKKPAVKNQKLVCGGRVLTDDQKIRSILASENDEIATVHLIISENSEVEETKNVSGQPASENGYQNGGSSSSTASVSPQALAAEALGITPPAAFTAAASSLPPPSSIDPNLANGPSSATAAPSNVNWANPNVPNGIPNIPVDFDFGTFNNGGLPSMNPFVPIYNPMMPPVPYPNPFAGGSLPGMPGIPTDGSLAQPGAGEDPAALQAFYDAQQLQYQQMLMMQIQMLQYQQQLLAMQSMSMPPSNYTGLPNTLMVAPFSPFSSVDGVMPTERHIPQAEPDASISSRMPSTLVPSPGNQAHSAGPATRPVTLAATSTAPPASYASGVRYPVNSQLHQRQPSAPSSSTEHQHTPRTTTETAATRTPSNQDGGAFPAPAPVAAAAPPAPAADPAPNIAPLPNLNQVFGVQLRLEINWGLIMKLAFFVFLLGQEGPAWRTVLLGIIALVIYLWQVGRLEFLQRSLARYIPNPGAALRQVRDTQLQRLIQLRTAYANANVDPNTENRRRNDPASTATSSTQPPTTAPASAGSSTASVTSTAPTNQIPQNFVQISSSFVFAFVYGFVCSLMPSWRPADLFQPNRENVGGDENEENNNANAGNNRPHID